MKTDRSVIICEYIGWNYLLCKLNRARFQIETGKTANIYVKSELK